MQKNNEKDSKHQGLSTSPCVYSCRSRTFRHV